MGRIVRLKADIRPSVFTQNMTKHRGDVSEGSLPDELARRTMLGRKTVFYRNGRHTVTVDGISEEEQHESELLRLAHASIITNAPVGDKQGVWVDATKDPVEVWLFGKPAVEFINDAVESVASGVIPADFVKDETPDHVMNGIRRGSTDRLKTIELTLGGGL